MGMKPSPSDETSRFLCWADVSPAGLVPVVNRFDTLKASRRNARIVASYQTRFHRHRASWGLGQEPRFLVLKPVPTGTGPGGESPE